MIFKATEEEIQTQQTIYKTEYPEWKPYDPTFALQYIGKHFKNIIATQNGQDTDDYFMNETHKVYRYIKDIPSGSSILFLGTGTGREVCAAKEQGLDAAGLTLGNRNTYFGRTRFNLTIDDLQEGLNECIPWEKESFDYVHGYQVFEHAMAPIIFLLEIGRVLKMGGQVFLEWPNGKVHQAKENEDALHQVCFTPGQARSLLWLAGFTNVTLTKETGEPIPEKDIWRNDQTYFMCVSGTKSPARKDYIKRAWEMV